MNRTFLRVLAALAIVATLAMGAMAAEKPVYKSVKGTIESVDLDGKKLIVEAGDGKVWTMHMRNKVMFFTWYGGADDLVAGQPAEVNGRVDKEAKTVSPTTLIMYTEYGRGADRLYDKRIDGVLVEKDGDMYVKCKDGEFKIVMGPEMRVQLRAPMKPTDFEAGVTVGSYGRVEGDELHPSVVCLYKKPTQ